MVVCLVTLSRLVGILVVWFSFARWSVVAGINCGWAFAWFVFLVDYCFIVVFDCLCLILLMF